MTFTHQIDRDVARLKTEAQAADKRRRDETKALEKRVAAIEDYLKSDLYPWLVDLEAFVAFGTPPPEPTW